MSYTADQGRIIFRIKHDSCDTPMYLFGMQYAHSNLYDINGRNKQDFFLSHPMTQDALKSYLGALAKEYRDGITTYDIGGKSGDLFGKAHKRVREAFERRDKFTLDITQARSFDDLVPMFQGAICETRGRIRLDTLGKPHFLSGIERSIKYYWKNRGDTVAEVLEHWLKESDNSDQADKRFFEDLLSCADTMREWEQACNEECSLFFKESEALAMRLSSHGPSASVLRQLFGAGGCHDKVQGLYTDPEASLHMLTQYETMLCKPFSDAVRSTIRDAYMLSGGNPFSQRKNMNMLARHLAEVLCANIVERNKYADFDLFPLPTAKENGRARFLPVGEWHKLLLVEFGRSDDLPEMLKTVISEGIATAGGKESKKEALINEIDLLVKVSRGEIDAKQYQSAIDKLTEAMWSESCAEKIPA